MAKHSGIIFALLVFLELRAVSGVRVVTEDEEEVGFEPSETRLKYMQSRLDVDLAGGQLAVHELTSTPRGPLEGETPKVAFIFLLVDGVDNEDIWDKFFEGGRGRQFSIYTHRCCAADDSEPPFAKWNAVSVPVTNQSWCALAGLEVAVFGHALKDPNNVQFVLLSQNAVPLKRFSYVYDQLAIKSPEKSKICFATPAAHPDSAIWQHMVDELMKRCQFTDFFRAKNKRIIKHHQWLVLSRDHAYTFVRMSSLALSAFQTAWRVSAPDIKDGGDGCSDEAIVGTALLLDVEERGLSTENPWADLEAANVDQNCLTWLRWRNCFRKTPLDLTETHVKSVVKAISSFRFGDLSQQADESGRTPGMMRVSAKLNGFPHYFGIVPIKYLKTLTQEGFMFGRKFNVGAKVRLAKESMLSAAKVVPLADILPDLWDEVDEEYAATRVWSRLEARGAPGMPVQSPKTELMEIRNMSSADAAAVKQQEMKDYQR